MIEDDIRAFLISDNTIASLVNNGDSPLTYRVQHERLVQQQGYPSIWFQQISEPSDYTLEDGKQAYNKARWQISACATTFRQCKTLARAIQDLFDGHIGPLVNGGVAIQVTRVLDMHDAFESAAMVAMCPVDVELQFNP